MAINICFSFILLYILFSISIEDINTMLISETKLTLLAILLGLGFLVEAIPAACLAAILFKVLIDIMDYRILPVLKKLPIILNILNINYRSSLTLSFKNKFCWFFYFF